MKVRRGSKSIVPQQIAEYLSTRPHLTRIVILMSGDVGFYSGARLVQDALPGRKDRLLLWNFFRCVFCLERHRLHDCRMRQLLSAHGRSLNLLNCVQRYPKIIMIVSGVEDVRAICQELVEAEMTYVHVTVGTNLFLSGRNGHIRYAGSLSAGGDDRTSYHAD